MSLPELVVTGSRLEARAGETQAAVHVIDREEIASSHVDTVLELLRSLAGLHVDQAGGRGGVSTAMIRGADPNFTLVLIDGVKVNDPNNSRGGSFDLSTLSLDNVERIEIAAGPLSSMYGSDALGGVIHIITRDGKGEEPAVSAEASGGRFDFYRMLVEARADRGRWHYSWAGSYQNSGESVEGSAFSSAQVTGQTGVSLTEAMDLKAVLRFSSSEAESFPDDSGGPLFAVIRETEKRDQDELGLALKWALKSSDTWNFLADWDYFHRQEDIDSPGVAPGIRDPLGIPANQSDNELDRHALSLAARHSGQRTNWVMGLSATLEEGESLGSLDFGGFVVPTSFSLSRGVLAPFIEVRQEVLPDLFLHGALRVDFPEGFKAEYSPRLGAVYTLKSSETRLSVNWGEGFKLPSFFALGHPLVGNRGLKPETSESVDLRVSQPVFQGRGELNLTLFHNKFFNAIDLAEGPPPILVNRSKVTTRGAEAGLAFKLGKSWRWKGSVTFVDSDIEGTEEELRNRPKWRGGTSLAWMPTDTFNLRAEAFTVGEVPDSSIPTGDVDLSSYTRVDLAASWTPRPTWDIFLRVDNLLDADYEEFAGFPAPGITPVIGVRKTFSAPLRKRPGSGNML